jgi:hypothetical protein
MICSSQTYLVSLQLWLRTLTNSNLGSQGWIQTNRTTQIRTDLLIEDCRQRETWPWSEPFRSRFSRFSIDKYPWYWTLKLEEALRRATPPAWCALPPRDPSAPAASGWHEAVRCTARPSYPRRRPKCCARARHHTVSPALWTATRIGRRGKRRGTQGRERKDARTSLTMLLISGSRN